MTDEQIEKIRKREAEVTAALNKRVAGIAFAFTNMLKEGELNSANVEALTLITEQTARETKKAFEGSWYHHTLKEHKPKTATFDEEVFELDGFLALLVANRLQLDDFAKQITSKKHKLKVDFNGKSWTLKIKYLKHEGEFMDFELGVMPIRLSFDEAHVETNQHIIERYAEMNSRVEKKELTPQDIVLLHTIMHSEAYYQKIHLETFLKGMKIHDENDHVANISDYDPHGTLLLGKAVSTLIDIKVLPEATHVAELVEQHTISPAELVLITRSIQSPAMFNMAVVNKKVKPKDSDSLPIKKASKNEQGALITFDNLDFEILLKGEATEVDLLDKLLRMHKVIKSKKLTILEFHYLTLHRQSQWNLAEYFKKVKLTYKIKKDNKEVKQEIGIADYIFENNTIQLAGMKEHVDANAKTLFAVLEHKDGLNGYAPEVIIRYLERYPTANPAALERVMKGKNIKSGKSIMKLSKITKPTPESNFYLQMESWPAEVWCEASLEKLKVGVGLGDISILFEKAKKIANYLKKSGYQTGNNPFDWIASKKVQGKSSVLEVSDEYIKGFTAKSWKNSKIDPLTNEEALQLVAIHKSINPYSVVNK